MHRAKPLVPAADEQRILRRPDVERKTGFRRAHIYALMQQGKFPKPIRLGKRAVGWDSADIDAWIASRRDPRA